MRCYKISIEDTHVPENRIDFYLGREDSIDNLLCHESFTSKFKDAKTGEEFTIKDKVIKALKIGEPVNPDILLNKLT